MNTVPVCRISILVFALLMLVGGIIGFKKAQSRASLISGILSAISLCYCFWQSLTNPLYAIKLAFVIIGALDGIFFVRLMKAKKFMPSGMLLVLCIVEQIELYLTMAR